MPRQVLRQILQRTCLSFVAAGGDGGQSGPWTHDCSWPSFSRLTGCLVEKDCETAGLQRECEPAAEEGGGHAGRWSRDGLTVTNQRPQFWHSRQGLSTKNTKVQKYCDTMMALLNLSLFFCVNNHRMKISGKK